MKYVILENIETNQRFFSLNGKNNTKLSDGTVAYIEIGFADTVREAQMKLYGRSYTNCED